MAPNEINLRCLPEALPRFFAIATYRLWEDRYDHLIRQIQELPFREPRLRLRFGIELELVKLQKHWRTTRRYPRTVESPPQAMALEFAVSALRIYRGLRSQGAKRRFEGMMRDGLQTERGLAPLAFEVGCAVDLAARGFQVQFSDLEGAERFDFLIKKDGVQAEFECKTVSYDLGRQIHRAVFERLVKEVLYAGLGSLLASPGPDLRIDVSLEARLPSGDAPFGRVVALVVAAAATGSASEPGVGSAVASNLETPKQIPTITKDIWESGLRLSANAHASIVLGPTGRKVALVAYSKKPDGLLKGVFRELKRVAKDQLTRTRPGFIAVRIEDVRDADWLDLARGSGLEMMTAAYFLTGEREHVHSVLYCSERILERGFGVAKLSGTRLVYRNPANALAQNSTLDLIES